MKEVKGQGVKNMRIFPFPDKIKSREELTRDIMYKKIPKDEIEAISDMAWNTGVEAAYALTEEYGSDMNIYEIAETSGLTIERVNQDNVSGNIRYFSEYYSSRQKIVLYLGSINKWAKANNMTMREAEELILYHEYFHFLECTKLGLTSKQYMVPIIQIGSFSFGRSGIRALSEIAAHGFSRTLYEIKGRLSYSKLKLL